MATDTGNIIAVGTAASGLDIRLRLNGVLTDPLSISYEIFEPGNTIVGSGAGFKRSVGHYDARNTVIPSGFSIASPWKINWTYTSPGNITSSSCENFTVVNALVASFTDFDNIVDLIKTDLGLADSDYTDNQYKQFLVKTIGRINRRLNFIGKSCALSIDDNGTISPTPDDGIRDIIILGVECLVVGSLRTGKTRTGIRIQDADTVVDKTAGLGDLRMLHRDMCKDFDRAIYDYWFGVGVNPSKKSPITAAVDCVTYADMKIIQELDHSGDSGGQIRDVSSPFDGTRPTEGR